MKNQIRTYATRIVVMTLTLVSSAIIMPASSTELVATDPIVVAQPGPKNNCPNFTIQDICELFPECKWEYNIWAMKHTCKFKGEYEYSPLTPTEPLLSPTSSPVPLNTTIQ
jgi:hypothetical protein